MVAKHPDELLRGQSVGVGSFDHSNLRFGEGDSHGRDRAGEGAGGCAGAEVREERGRAEIGSAALLMRSLFECLTLRAPLNVIYSVETRKHFLSARSNFCRSRARLVRVADPGEPPSTAPNNLSTGFEHQNSPEFRRSEALNRIAETRRQAPPRRRCTDQFTRSKLVDLDRSNRSVRHVVYTMRILVQ
jgi:hypothetical protein